MDAYADGSTLNKKKPRSVDAALNRLYELSQKNNIAEDLSEEELTTIGKKVCEEFQIDLNSRSDWELAATRALDIALQKTTPKNTPFANASNIKWPLLLTAASQFNARSYPEICSADGIVKTIVVGKDEGVPKLDEQGQPVVDQQSGEPEWEIEPGAKAEKAERISEHMSYQLREEDVGWEDDMDTLLMQLPIVGDVVKKVYRGEDTPAVSEMLSALDFVVNQNTKSLDKCPRMTHRFRLYPYEIDERRADGRFRDVEYRASVTGDNDDQEPHELLEQHRRLDLDKDGYAEPYIVTVHRESEKVCRIVANFEADDVKSNDKRILSIKPAEYFVNFIFLPDPKGGFYGVGFGQLLGPLNAAIDSMVNQMTDAETLKISGGGFIGSGVRLKKNIIRRELGVWQYVNASGENLRNAMVPFEDKGASPVTFSLLELLLQAATDISSVKDILSGDSPQGETATTTLARVEQGLKVFTAIYKRVYRALTKEFKLRFRLNAKYLDQQAYFNVLDTTKAVSRTDYNEDDYDVCPQADPRLVTDMQRLKRAEALLATAQINPAGIPEILKRYYTAVGAEDVDALLPKQDQPDPAQELAIANAEAEVKKTTAEAGLAEAKTEQVTAEIGQEDNRQQLAALEALDDSTRHDDQMENDRVSIVADHKKAEEDRKVMSAKAAQSNKAKRPGQS